MQAHEPNGSAEADLPPIDARVVAAKLRAYQQASLAASALLAQRTTLLKSMLSAATELQAELGDDTVLLLDQMAFVPFVGGGEGTRPAYEVVPVFDLDAALLGSARATRSATDWAKLLGLHDQPTETPHVDSHQDQDQTP